MRETTDVLPKDIKEALGPGRHLVYKDMAAEFREELWKRFVACLVPLQVNGKLGLVHFQFSPKVVRHPAAVAHIEHCLEHLPGQADRAPFGSPFCLWTPSLQAAVKPCEIRAFGPEARDERCSNRAPSNSTRMPLL